MPTIDASGVTFEWAGAAHQVVVTGSWCDWRADTALPLRPRRDGTWAGHLALPPEAYVEYRLMVDGEAIPDPANPSSTYNGIDGDNNQLWMPAASRRAAALRARRGPRGEVRRGRLTLGWLAATPKRRRFDLYLPPGTGETLDPARLRLLVVLDGADYLDRGRLHRLMDGLIGLRLMAPVATAFIDNAGPSRGVEYAGNDFTVATLAAEIVPAAVERLGLASQDAAGGQAIGRAAILGSSMGGWMALHAVLRRPQLFGSGILQSVAAFSFGELSTVLLARHLAPPPVRLWQDAGDYEWLAEANDRLAALLRERGYDLAYRRHHGGHDQTSWSESLVDALPAIFPP
ncbi:MAG TPA: alpha/beta hydrolase-fold protein [Candidatus Limnocylindrales bacterium]